MRLRIRSKLVRVCASCVSCMCDTSTSILLHGHAGTQNLKLQNFKEWVCPSFVKQQYVLKIFFEVARGVIMALSK